MPAGLRLSLNAKVRKRDVVLSASVSASPIYMEIEKEKKLSLEGLRLLIDGMLSKKVFSGGSTVGAVGIQYADYAFYSLRGGFRVHYEEDIMTIRDPKIGTGSLLLISRSDKDRYGREWQRIFDRCPKPGRCVSGKSCRH